MATALMSEDVEGHAGDGLARSPVFLPPRSGEQDGRLAILSSNAARRADAMDGIGSNKSTIHSRSAQTVGSRVTFRQVPLGSDPL